jgi:hypothetical protein
VVIVALVEQRDERARVNRADAQICASQINRSSSTEILSRRCGYNPLL